MTDAYVELRAHSYFSLLDASSSPEALVARAQDLGYPALALTDQYSLAGAVRFWRCAREHGIQPILGAEVTLDRAPLTLLAETQTGYANLCRLLTAAHLCDTPTDLAAWPGKGEPSLTWELLAQHHTGLLALSAQRDAAPNALSRLCDLFGRERLWVALTHHALPDDDRCIRTLSGLARELALPVVATHDVRYATRHAARLRDALVAIRHNLSLTEARRAGLLPYNQTYYLPSAADVARRFRELPQALANTLAIAERCHVSPVSLDFAQQRLPPFSPPNPLSEFAYLYQLCHDGLPHRYPTLTPQVLNQLAHELHIIEQAGLAGYFLVVWDIVRFARERGIRCQGRGSAANSLVAYLLHITNVDPLQHNLLFERFLSADRYTIPDIDIDFAADRREEVIQYVYERYGREHVAMVCNSVTYQARSAVRDLAKALGFPQPVIDRLAKSLDAHAPSEAATQLEQTLDAAAPAHHPIRLLVELLRQIQDCPRHRSIHVGGMLVTQRPLAEIVPLERATMAGRVVCQWDKDSVEDAGLIKIDLLSLRTLGLIEEALTYIPDPPDLDALSLDDPALYDLLARADTIGAFQVESRAQQQMLPRLKPTCFEDITVEVAIVRPGPIQGGAVHPYLKRRAGVEPVTYLHPSLEPVLRESLGVLLFQEQAIRVSMVAARFSPSEADMLRRAMSRSRSYEAMDALRERFVQGATGNGIARETAEAIFQQLQGFAGFGFCKSHAASFALIAYQTLYLKRYHAPAFYCALLNQQPMGFYAPEVIIGDAKRHGVALLPPDIHASAWRYTLEGRQLRMGLQTVSGLGQPAAERIAAARAEKSFVDVRDFCLRTRLPPSTVSDLIRAGAMDVWGARRQLLWQLGAIDYRPDELPLVLPETPVTLPELDAHEQTRWEYELLGLSPHGQLMRHYRAALNRAGVLSSSEVKQRTNGRTVRVGGMAVVKQSPPTAKGIVFVSLEDEFGMLDLTIKPNVFARFRPLLRHQTFLLVEGVVQQASGAISVLVTRAIDFRQMAAT